MTKKKANEALLNAVRKGDVEGMKTALAAGADVNACDEKENSMLMTACNHPECVKLLIEAGVDVNAEYGGCTALHIAANEGCTKTVELLLAVPGIDVNAYDEDGWTPLDYASKLGHSEVEALLEAAIDQECLKAAEAEEDYDDEDEDCEEEINVWKGEICQMQEYKMYFPGTLSELLHVGENDRLMYVNVCVNESSNEWQEDEYIVIFLKREGDAWKDICWPKVPHDDADPYFPEKWNWQEILDQVWEEKTVTYTTQLNDDYEQVEASWEVEE